MIVDLSFSPTLGCLLFSYSIEPQSISQCNVIETRWELTASLNTEDKVFFSPQTRLLLYILDKYHLVRLFCGIFKAIAERLQQNGIFLPTFLRFCREITHLVYVHL